MISKVVQAQLQAQSDVDMTKQRVAIVNSWFKDKVRRLCNNAGSWNPLATARKGWDANSQLTQCVLSSELYDSMKSRLSAQMSNLRSYSCNNE